MDEKFHELVLFIFFKLVLSNLLFSFGIFNLVQFKIECIKINALNKGPQKYLQMTGKMAIARTS
jgi:hypothetical protein